MKNCAQLAASKSAAQSGSLPVADALEQTRAAEGHVDHDRNPAFGGERQDRFLDAAVVDRVVDADEVERLLAHDARELAVLFLAGGRHADVADALRGLQLLQDPELDGDVAQVVNLDEVHRFDAEAPEGFLDLGPRRRGIGGAAAARRDIDLRRPEDLSRDAELACEPARDFLRCAVGWRRVEDTGAVVDHRVEDFAQ